MTVVSRFVQGIDYGPRSTPQHPGVKPTALEYHMSEGGDELVTFLARHPGESITDWHSRVNGVSCSVAILSTGEVVQMVKWDHVNGNLNPADRAGEYGYYGHSTLVAVLGDPEWTDPNVYSLSAEIAGHRDVGPTDKQVTAAIAWGQEMIGLFPSLRGAYGHHDQSPKPCPGLTANMKAIFTGVGGHGLWTAAPPEGVMFPTRFPGGGRYGQVAVNAGKTVYKKGDGSPVVVGSTGSGGWGASAVHDIPGGSAGFGYTSDSTGTELWVDADDATITPDVVPADCTAEVKAEHDKVKAAAVAAAEAIP